MLVQWYNNAKEPADALEARQTRPMQHGHLHLQPQSGKPPEASSALTYGQLSDAGGSFSGTIVWRRSVEGQMLMYGCRLRPKLPNTNATRVRNRRAPHVGAAAPGKDLEQCECAMIRFAFLFCCV